MSLEVPVPILGKDILTADEVIKAIGSLGGFNFRLANMRAIDAMERMIVILKDKNKELLKNK